MPTAKGDTKAARQMVAELSDPWHVNRSDYDRIASATGCTVEQVARMILQRRGDEVRQRENRQ